MYLLPGVVVMFEEQIKVSPVINFSYDDKGSQSAELYYQCQAKVEMIQVRPIPDLLTQLDAKEVIVKLSFQLNGRVEVQDRYLASLPSSHLLVFANHIKQLTNLNVYIELRSYGAFDLRFMRNFDGQLLKLWPNFYA